MLVQPMLTVFHILLSLLTRSWSHITCSINILCYNYNILDIETMVCFPPPGTPRLWGGFAPGLRYCLLTHYIGYDLIET